MKRFFSLAATLLVAGAMCAQSDPKLPEVVPPSPTVANLMKFEEVPIDYYSGQPNISIPLFSKQIGKGIGFNLALSYSTSGVMIDNKSGWTGTGWSLFAGGTISRTVRDVPDEAQKGSPGFGVKTGIYHNANYWNYGLPGSNPEAFAWKAVGSSVDKYDLNPDLYQFNFMGYSGRFIIVKNGNLLEAREISKTNNFKINLNYNSSTYVINSFTITDTNGFKYTFDVIESSSTHTSSETMSQQQGTATTGTSNTYSFNSAWHLSKIETPKGDNLATLSYISVSEDTGGIPSKVENRIVSTDANHSISILIGNSYNNSIMEPRYIISQSNSTIATRKVSSISFRDGSSILFNAVVGHPEFNGTGRKLQDVILKDVNGNEYKRYTLTYQTTTPSNRLWLTKVSEIAGGTTLDTQLNYYNKSLLPKYGDGFDEGDSWGYFSGIDEKHSFANPFDEDQIKTGLLTSIEYPTGGVKEFSFENNAYSYYGNQAISEDDYLKNPMNITNNTSSTTNFVYSNPQNNFPEIPIYNTGSPMSSFTLAFEQDIYISSSVTQDANNKKNEHEIWVEDTSGNLYGRADLNVSGVLIPNLPSGTYKFLFATKGIETATNYQITLGSVSVEYKKSIANPRQEMLGGGVRIKSVTFRDSPTSGIAKKVNYEYIMENDALKSSGVIDAKSDIVKRNYSTSITKQLFDNLFSDNNPAGYGAVSIWYDVTQYGPNMNTQMTKGNFVGYRHVKVAEVELAGPSLFIENGHTLYDYTSAFEYQDYIDVFSLPNSRPASNIDYKRGLLKKQRIYDANDRIVKQVENTNYSFVEDLIYTERAAYKPNCEWIQYYDTWDWYNSGTVNGQINIPTDHNGNTFMVTYLRCGGNPINLQSTDYKSGWAQLKETITKDYYYSTNSPSATPTIVESKKNYTYNSSNYQVASESTTLKESGADVNYQTTYKYPVDGNFGGNSSTIVSRLNALNKVNEVLQTETTRSVGVSQGDIISKTNTTYNIINGDNDLVLPTEVKTAKGSGSVESRIEFHKYDEYDNPIEVSQKDGTHIVYIWGYDKTLPIAKIENATFTDIPTTIYNDVINKSNLDDSIADENNLRTALATLRNHANLSNAMVTTFTYDPSKGITSVTDPRGETIFYEYDEFNRLKQVKDAYGKIVSHNQYNYKN